MNTSSLRASSGEPIRVRFVFLTYQRRRFRDLMLYVILLLIQFLFMKPFLPYESSLLRNTPSLFIHYILYTQIIVKYMRKYVPRRGHSHRYNPSLLSHREYHNHFQIYTMYPAYRELHRERMGGDYLEHLEELLRSIPMDGLQ